MNAGDIEWNENKINVYHQIIENLSALNPLKIYSNVYLITIYRSGPLASHITNWLHTDAIQSPNTPFNSNWTGLAWTCSVRSADGAAPCRASEWNYKIYISSGFTSILFKFQIYTHCIWSSSQTPFCSANSTVWSFPTTVFVFIIIISTTIALCCAHGRRGVGKKFSWVTELCELSLGRQIIHSDLCM